MPIAGRVTGSWLVPNVPSAVGQSVHMQVVGIELDAFGIVRLTGSNALKVTIGAL